MRRQAIIMVCALLAGCSGDASPRTDPATVTTVDGVLHVSFPSFPPDGVSQIHASEVFTTATNIELYNVTAARFLPDGRLAVANAGTNEILVLDPTGELRQRLGGEGEGPGEFSRISALHVDTAAHIRAYDPRLGRLTRMSADGSSVETHRLAPPNRIVDLLPLAFLSDGRIAAIYGEMRSFGRSGVGRDTVPLMLFDADGTRADTIGLWPATEWAFMAIPQGAAREEVGFGGALAYAGRNGRFAIGSTDTLNIVVYDADAQPIRRIAGGPTVEVDAADVERWRSDMVESWSRAPEEMRRALVDVPHNPTYPAFSHLVLDDVGRLWIGAYARPTAAERAWVVIGTDGEVQETLMLPAEARILDVASDRIVLLSRDELDEEVLSVLAVTPD